ILHIITDGRDTPPQSGIDFLADLEAFIADGHPAQISSVSGRYYAMDRDNRAERTQLAYDAITRVGGKSAETAQAAILGAYSAETTDEFILPTIINGDNPAPPMRDGDVLLFFNFRADRMRQIVRAFFMQAFDEFPRQQHPNNLRIFSMTRYERNFPVTVLFDKQNIKEPLADVISKAGFSQFHAAETEKYPHVTYFFNGGREAPHPQETHHVTPSPKVATYDLQPEMSAYELTEAVLERLATYDDAFILLNYANPDMVGHTGSLPAAIKAVETVDACAAKIVAAVLKKGGIALVTADHGNCEIMLDEQTQTPHTYHTTNPVSLIAISNTYLPIAPRGKLADIAPTILTLLDITPPALMTGQSLI
ncbi:MAG TPA: 2,3-bisphosphoglycerate-independent phosphoglycerate mutase, partial [Anaerolineae bacterium]|nr:2,3-bisphosphoglycerate-independent phosphoglycerate mutase [Anaerolineae bacterium]